VTLQTDLTEHGTKEDNGIWDPSSSGLSGEEADPTDAADQIEELVTNVPIVQELASRLRDVDDALAKMGNKNYGLDETTGEEIPYERLVANPAARTTVAHA
jgi:RNA polymerase-binding transcription factor DksA